MNLSTCTWPAPGTVPSPEDNRGTTAGGQRYRYSSAHNGFVMLADELCTCSTPENPVTVRECLQRDRDELDAYTAANDL